MSTIWKMQYGFKLDKGCADFVLWQTAEKYIHVGYNIYCILFDLKTLYDQVTTF